MFLAQPIAEIVRMHSIVSDPKAGGLVLPVPFDSLPLDDPVRQLNEEHPTQQNALPLHIAAHQLRGVLDGLRGRILDYIARAQRKCYDSDAPA